MVNLVFRPVLIVLISVLTSERVLASEPTLDFTPWGLNSNDFNSYITEETKTKSFAWKVIHLDKESIGTPNSVVSRLEKKTEKKQRMTYIL